MQRAARPHVYSPVETVLNPLFPPPRFSTVTTVLDPVIPIEDELRSGGDAKEAGAVQAELLLMTSLSMPIWFDFLVPILIGFIFKLVFGANPHAKELVHTIRTTIPGAGFTLGLALALVCLARWAKTHRWRGLVFFGGLAFNLVFLGAFKALGLYYLDGVSLLVPPVITLLYATLRARIEERYCLAQAAAHTSGPSRRAAFTLDLEPFGVLGWFIEPYAQLYRWILPLVIRPARLSRP